MAESIYQHKLDNGLTLVAESMDWLESASLSIFSPAGCQYDPPNKRGLSNFTIEMVQRGSGERDSRQFSDALELLGIDLGSSVSIAHSNFSGAMPAERLMSSLPTKKHARTSVSSKSDSQ